MVDPAGVQQQVVAARGWRAAVVRRLTPSSHAETFAASLMVGGAVYTVLLLLVMVVVCGSHGRELGVSMAIVFASATAGGVVGFTFGIPKLSGLDSAGITVKDDAKLVANSNYGKVSDWLTTLVIGLGLVQFGKVLDGMGWLGSRFAVAFEPLGLSHEAGAAYGLSLVVASLGITFLLVFMWTSVRYMEVSKPAI